MAGGGPQLLFDPAIEKWFNMQENTHHYFKFNRRTTTHVLALAVAFPLFLYAGASAKKVRLIGVALR
ncbi:hypothetical protein HDU79_009381 [Rhizoclosmatium sp. JEL0117]|nr:hypothetical protein HDU79_009381 [Rhizoclosmatium sp. JEL0117]